MRQYGEIQLQDVVAPQALRYVTAQRALLRPIGDVTSQDHLRELILEAFVEFEERVAIAI